MGFEPIRILLVEDNPGDARLLREFLTETEASQFELVHADRLSEAVRRLGEGRFGAILLDLSLPDAHGLETITRLRSQSAGTPIVVLTGLDNEEAAIKALEQGAQDYLIKGRVDGHLLVRALRYAIQRQRAEEQIQQQLQRMNALREINLAISSTLDLRNVLDILLEKIDLSLPYASATIRLLNKDTGLLDPIACRNLDEQEWKASQWRGGRGIANIVFETKAPLFIRNAQADARVLDQAFYRKHKLTSYIGVPLIVKDEALGVLGFYTKEEHEFTGEEVDFLSTLAGQAAIAIHNSQLYEETEHRRREAEELARVAQSLTETLDMTAVGERIVTSVRKLFGVKTAILRLLQPDGSLRALASSGETFLQDSRVGVISDGMGIVGQAVAEGRSIWSRDVLNDPKIRLSDEMRDYHVQSGNRSMIAVPLHAHERVIGSLGLSDQTGRAYSKSEIALLQTFADQAALALENARLYNETRTREAELKETNRMLSALHAVAAAASQSVDLDRVLHAAIEKITDIFAFDATQIHIFNERTDELLLRAAFERDPNRFATAKSFRRGQGIVGKVAESGNPLIFEDVQNDPVYRQFSRSKISGQSGYRLFAVFPIRGKLRNLGTLACTGVEPRKLSSGEIQLLEAMADQIAVAIENGELYEQLRQKIEELQQANKVKDEFLSVMSHELRTPLNVVMGYTAMIKDEMLGTVNPEQKKALEKVIMRSSELLNMITGILYATSIEAKEVRVQNSQFALSDLLDELSRSYKISLTKPITLKWDCPSDLPALTSDREKLRFVLQKIIDNATKFTETGGVTISAGLRESSLRDANAPPVARRWLEIKVADTGAGIAKEKLPIIFEKFRQADSTETRRYGGVGLGLYIAKQFTDLIGGKIEVDTEEGKGSIFTVKVPCLLSSLSAANQRSETQETLAHVGQIH